MKPVTVATYVEVLGRSTEMIPVALAGILLTTVQHWRLKR